MTLTAIASVGRLEAVDFDMDMDEAGTTAATLGENASAEVDDAETQKNSLRDPPARSDATRE